MNTNCVDVNSRREHPTPPTPISIYAATTCSVPLCVVIFRVANTLHYLPHYCFAPRAPAYLLLYRRMNICCEYLILETSQLLYTASTHLPPILTSIYIATSPVTPMPSGMILFCALSDTNPLQRASVSGSDLGGHPIVPSRCRSKRSISA